jgi:hypothetical protein
MQLPADVLDAQLQNVFELLDNADPQDLPVAVRFLLQAATGENIAKVHISISFSSLIRA